MLTSQRDRFALPPGLHYLNGAYMSPLLDTVEAAGVEGVRRKRDPTRITAPDYFEDADRVRDRFARLVGAPDPGRVAVVPAVSYGMAVVARNLRLERGQTVVVVEEQFPSNVLPWRRPAEAAGAEVVTVRAPDAARRGEAWNAALLDAVDGRCALVAVPHVHWADGTLFDLEAVRDQARAVGAALVVDGTQSVGALPFPFERVRPDALVCAGYKWLLGPYGAGCAYFGERFDGGEPLEETWIGRAGSEDFGGLVHYREAYGPGAVRYDVGERSNPILLPMLVAALDQLLAWTPEAIQEAAAALADRVASGARALGFGVEDADLRAGHLFGLRPPDGVTPDDVRAALEARRVAVSVRGRSLRVSPGVYNDASDADALLAGLAEAVGAPAPA